MIKDLNPEYINTSQNSIIRKPTTQQRHMAEAEETAHQDLRTGTNLMTWFVKKKAYVAGEYTKKMEKVDEVWEVERAKKRSLNFIPNMMESHCRSLSRWVTWAIYIF